MLYYIKKYPISFFIILLVIFLSFFNPPETGFDPPAGFDKLVHFCMYFGMSGALWMEFFLQHRRDRTPVWHAWIGACLCPLLFGGGIELLQEFCTKYRGGDWWDFMANAAGVITASLIAYYCLKTFARRG